MAEVEDVDCGYNEFDRGEVLLVFGGMMVGCNDSYLGIGGLIRLIAIYEI